MDDSCKSTTPMVLATMQRDAVAGDLLAFNRRYAQPIRQGEDGYDECMDQWEAMEKKKKGLTY
eukprot:3983716-Amphidinium_carterae.1